MALPHDVTRTLIASVLERAGTVGLDAAGSLLGPAWPFVKPVLVDVLKTVSKGVASSWRAPGEHALRADDAEVARIGKLLADHGITADWARALPAQLDAISDDVVELVAASARTEQRLERIAEMIGEHAARSPGRLVLRRPTLEYVDFLRVGDDFFDGWDLAPDTWEPDAVPQRHLPAGFFVWNFVLFNAGAGAVVVSGFDLRVDDEQPCPADAAPGRLLPTLDPFEGHAELARGAKRHRLFVGRRLQLHDDDVDAFRILVSFADPGPAVAQRLRLRIAWSNAGGDHYSDGPPLFLASMPSPPVHLAGAKFGVRSAPPSSAPS